MQKDLWMKDLKNKLKKGKLIKYNFLYSNEEEKYGMIYDVKKDNNFVAMITILTDGCFDVIPYSVMEYTILE